MHLQKFYRMIRVVDVVFHHHHEFDDPLQVLSLHGPAIGFAEYIGEPINIRFVKHLNHEGNTKIKGIHYTFFKGNNRFWHIPVKTNRYIRDLRPDVVIIEGLIFPLQTILLKIKLGKNCKIIVQHHGEKHFSGIKGWFQKFADRYVGTYLFTSRDNAVDWINNGIIDDGKKVWEVQEASTHFVRQDILESRNRTGIQGNNNFLWVGRLDANKDPITVLKAFEKYYVEHDDAKLFMIFQNEEWLPEIELLLLQSKIPAGAINLVGRVKHEELPYWYSAASFYISGSHQESCGYSLLEAMACGCIPIVTAIPSFVKITQNGKYGFLYPPGNSEALLSIFNSLHSINIETDSQRIENYFRDNLSFKNIAADLSSVLMEIKG
jgi:glycosyltransferase involved in cell wall biosynthesis